MTEYISREEAIKELREVYENEYPTASGDFDEYASHDMPNVLRNIPAADVQPVKRGRWIETHISLCKWIPENEKEEGHNFYMAELKCSCCERYNTNTFSLTLEKPDFCQHCGARMDGGSEYKPKDGNTK